MPKTERRRQYVVAYDSSGTFNQHSAVAYVGAVSTGLQWNAFVEKWREVLDRHGLEYFKMAEAMRNKGLFEAKLAEWDKDYLARRDGLVNELAALKARYGLAVTGHALCERSGPLRADTTVLEAKKQMFKGAIHALLQGIPADSLVTLTCDIELDAEESYRGWIQHLTTLESPTQAQIVGMSFFNDVYAPPVQFADMAAWVVREEAERLGAGRRNQDPLLPILMGGTTINVEFMGAPSPSSASEEKRE